MSTHYYIDTSLPYITALAAVMLWSPLKCLYHRSVSIESDFCYDRSLLEKPDWFCQFKELARHIADQSISEKKLTVSGKLVSPEAKSEDNESSLISHTVTDSSPLEQTQDLIKYQLQDRRAASSQLSIDETVGYDCDSVDQQEQTSQRSDGTVREGDHLPLSNKNEDEKSPPPSPVSTLLNEVFVSINGDGQSSSEEGKNLLHNIQEKQPAMDFSRASGGIAERKPQPKSNRPVSPLSVSDAEEGEAAAGDNSSDSLIFCEPPVPRDIIVTKVKQVSHEFWICPWIHCDHYGTTTCL